LVRHPSGLQASRSLGACSQNAACMSWGLASGSERNNYLIRVSKLIFKGLIYINISLCFQIIFRQCMGLEQATILFNQALKNFKHINKCCDYFFLNTISY